MVGTGCAWNDLALCIGPSGYVSTCGNPPNTTKKRAPSLNKGTPTQVQPSVAPTSEPSSSPPAAHAASAGSLGSWPRRPGPNGLLRNPHGANGELSGKAFQLASPKVATNPAGNPILRSRKWLIVLDFLYSAATCRSPIYSAWPVRTTILLEGHCLVSGAQNL